MRPHGIQLDNSVWGVWRNPVDNNISQRVCVAVQLQDALVDEVVGPEVQAAQGALAAALDERGAGAAWDVDPLGPDGG